MASYVIVGASRGLGYQWLRTLGADKSNNVIGVARSPEPVRQKLAADGLTNVTVVQGDMADAVSLRTAAASVHRVTGGKVDYLIVNGTFQMADSGPLTAPDFIGKEDLIRTDVLQSAEVNVLGTIYSINAFLSLVKNGTAKKIVAISSGLADRELALKSGVSSEVVYSAMKAAVNVVVAKFAVALKSDGITLLALSPGVVNTKENLDISNDDLPPAARDLFSKFQALYPKWDGPLTPEVSVAAQKKVIEGLTLEQSGSFLSHWGNQEWL